MAKLAVLLLPVLVALGANAASAAAVDCLPADNEITCENRQPGNPPSQWDVNGAGDLGIQGYATDISVDQGEAVNFKVDTASGNYRLDIYRLGYYNGDGARLIDTVQPTEPPDVQDPCLDDALTGLVDCGNWAQSASWAVPAAAVSGVYIAHLVREDGPGESHMVFIVRDDDGNSDLLVQTDDTTWQAYNQYGGNSLYTGSPAGRAYKVSYNRPFTSRGPTPEDWVFNATSPLIRWIERNGYDVSYFTGVDSHRSGAEIQEHDAFISVGHDEYWSAGQRSNVTAARNAGTDLAFFSGNEVFWKTRWEPSIDGADTPNRTLVSYKETHANAKIDPEPNIWTGTWRDPRFSPPADGGNPENGLTGTMFRVNSGTSEIEVPEADGNMRLWRNTGPDGPAGLAPGQTEDLATDTLGYEWDEAPDNSSRPPGLVYNSSTTRSGVEVLQDNGSSYGSGTATHHLTQYRDANGAGPGDDALVFGAGTIQWAWGLDGVHDRGGSTPDPDMQQATANLFADMGAQPQTLQGGLVAAAASTDTTAPSSLIESPLPDAEVESGAPFEISGTATDAGGGVVGAVEVSTDDGASWHPATGRESWTYSWTPGPTGPATIRTRATDDSGNIETPGAGVAVDVVPAAPQSCPCSIWENSLTGPAANDSGAVELGVKFRSDDDGFITGLRFYKATASNGGTHIGRLWTAAGGELASATFATESATGWQEVTFGAPVAINADTTYVASYHSPQGFYAAINGYFAGGGFDNAPLHAVANGSPDGPNGVYRYGAGGVFPTDTFESSNYLVDVVFENDVGPDTTPPTITGRTPANGANGVATGTDVTATFNEPMDAATINATNVELRDPGNALVPATVTYNPANRRATLNPDVNLQNSTTYTAKVVGGPGGVEDDADPGNPLAADSTWSFTTAAAPPPPPDEGPGGPILVISDSSNPFSRYYAEILRSEGLNEFTVTDRSLVTPAILNAHDVVVLGDTGLSGAQVTMLDTWVNAGGNLIAMKPDPQLAGLLGLTDTPDTLANAYIQVDTGSPPGAGIVGQTMQFHSTADRYTPNGAQTIATLYSDASTSTPNPAVTLEDVGSNGGQAAAFTYDLARSVVYTRQGNPAWSGDERDSAVGGSQLIRSDDLFYGAKPGDVKPDWVDLNKVAIPQADEQQHLLTNLIQKMNVDRKPLPQFWFLPRDEKAAVVLTGDDHAAGGTEGQFNTYQAANPGCTVADWECVRATSYIYPNTTSLTDAEAGAFESAGFEIALHVNTNCANWADRDQLEGFYTSQLASFAANYPSLDAASTNRTHCIAWSDWATQPKVELQNGIRLDTNYYYWPSAWVQNRPGMFTGSGLPQRFADLDGSMIDVYQAATQMNDEADQTFPFNIDTLLDNALGPQGYYGVFTANMHTDAPSHSGADAIIASAGTRDVPVVSARQMLEWLDGRNGSSFGSISWDENKLNFNISVGAGANGLRAMVPTTSSVGTLTGVELGTTPIPTTTRTTKGVEYAFFDAAPGPYEATYAVDDTPPAITNVAHSPQTNGTANVTWDTNEASDSRVDYGTNPSNLNQSQSSSGLVTSHDLQLTGLAPNTTYHYRVTSADAASNSTTDPEPPAAPRNFTTPSANLTDTTVSDFSAGTTGPNNYVSETGDGEVTLKPTEGQEFSGGPGQPAGWTGCSWPACSPGSAPGPATVSGGSLHVNGGMANTNATYGPGRALEFKATFGAAPFQHIAFTDNFNNVWAMFSTRGTTNQLFASTNSGGVQDSAIGGLDQYVGSSHLYRIEWDVTQVRYYVDGALVQTHNITAFGPNLNVAVSDFNSGVPDLSVDWLRMSPYPAAGTFNSRVFDAGQSASWGALTWTSALPPGSSLAMSVRTGDTPTPDGTWSAFTPIASSGADIPGNSRYVQYRAELATTDAARTPTLSEVSIAFAAGADLTPPTIANRAPAPNATNVARNTNVDVQFSEAMNPATINASTVRLRKQGTGADVPASVSYSGNAATIDPTTDLDPGAVYDLTVKGGAGGVADAADNELAADDTWSFTTVPLTFIDDTTAEFGAGTPGADTYVSQTDDGEVTLKPTEGSEFGGASIPGGWRSCPWSDPTPEDCDPGTGGTVSGGSVHLDGAYAKTIATYTSNHSLEFVANFGGENNQHVGFGVDLNNSSNWAIFSRKFDGTFNARTMNGGSETTMPLPGSLFNSPHLYRIEWDTNEVRYYVDGTLVATHASTFGATQMRPIATDLTPGGPEITVDWMRMSPYPASGTFDSRIFDARTGQVADWGALNWDSTTPPATGIALSVRTGDTPTPDGTWTGFTTIGTNGGDIPGSSRYVQYRAQLTTSDNTRTPTLSQVSIGYLAGPDVTAPTIAGRSPAPNATDVPRSTNVDVQFSEAMNPATINASTVRLRKQGAGADVPASVSYAGNTATLNPTADLDPGAVYNVSVKGGAGGAADAAGTALDGDDTWSFTTAPLSFNFIDTTDSDFSAGSTGTDTYVSKADNGEVTLKPTVGEEFSDGPGLPGGWEGAAWGGGGAVTVSGDALHANGAYARTTAFYGSGRSLEYAANFAATPFETVGFANDLNAAPWATFSTTAGGGTLFTRTDNGQPGGQLETNLGAGLLGSSHVYRIEWDTNEVRFYVDGGLVATHAVTFGATQMRPIASEFGGSGPEVTVDWMRMSPYPASGTFDSRIFDAGTGQVADWGALNWDSTTPPATGIALSVRTGDTPTPDGTWTGFTAIGTNGGDIPGSSRYVQYRAQLTTSDNTRTPTLSRVEVNGVQATPPPDAPTITATDPLSPANNNDPKVKGTVGAGDPTQAKIWKNATCDGAPDATGTVAQFTGAGITVNVGDNTTTALSAKVSNAGGDSACSNTINYVEDSAAPEAPTINTSTPTSPANENDPELAGDAEAGSTVRIYKAPTTDDCTPANLAATGSAAEFAAGLTVNVANDTTTTFRATASDAGNTSACGAAFTYLEDSAAPETTIDSGPSGPTANNDPSFTFSGSDPGGSGVASFECSLDGAAFAACSSPEDYTDLDEGDHAFAVRAIDQAQNTDQSPASSAFSVDTAAPEAPTINTSTPTSPANENDPELAGDAEAGSTVRIYKAPTTDDCTPANLAATGSAAEFAAGLTVNVANDTTTTFRATASDAGNTSACGAAFTYLEDSAAPETTIDSGPSGPTANNDPSFTFSGSDPGGSGVASFECSLDGAAFAACSSPEDYTDLDEGDHAFAVRAIDQAQNTDQSPASSAFSVDTAAPEAPTINTSTPTSPANENDPELAGDAEAGSTVRIYKAPTTDDCTPANLAATGSAAEFAAGLTVNVANDTTTTFRATASDAGNTSACGAAFTYLEDSAAPETTIDSGPSGPTANNDPSFTFSGSDPGGSGVASFECSLDGAAFAACSSPEDYTDLDEGDHAFAVRAIDQAQNTDQSPASSAFSVDTAAPEAPTINTSTPTSPANENDPELAGDAEAGSTVRIYKAPTTDDCTPANLAATGSAAEFAAGLTVNVANDTTTTFRATASDAGNTSACGAAFTYLEDSAAPETTIDSGPSGPTANNDPSFTFSGSDPGGSGVASFECSLDGAAFAACSSPEDYTDLDEGDHAFAVRAIDQAQNTDQSPASSAFSVDTAAPEAPTINTSTPTSPANENDPELAGDAEAGSTVRIYKAPTTDDCTPANLAATGSAAEFAAGLTVNVANDTTTTFRATASDAGNTSACGAAFTYLEDSAAPETTIDSGPSGPTANNDPSFTFSGSDPGGSGVASFECSLDGAAFAACSSPEDYTDLDEGDHAFAVRAIDQAQNTDQSPASSAFSVDTAAPEAPTINTSTPTSPANENDPELAGDAEAGSTVRIYKAPTTDDCTPANLAATGSAAEFAAGLTVNVANDTTTTFRATASDAGNTSACGAAFTYLEDSAAPETTIDSGPSGPTANNDPSFTFSGSDPGGSGVASFECSLDGAAFAACSSPEDYTDLDEGDHAFAVRAIDQAQNTDQSPASSAFSVDTAAPEAPTINTSTPTSPANENDPELAGDAEAGSTVRIYKAPTTDDCTPANLAATGSAAEFAAGLTVNVANDTTTTFRATASDAGNTSACGAAFTYLEDSAAPETTIDSGPSGPTANNDPSFTFSGSDPGGSGVASFECSLDGAAFAACSSPEDYTDLDEGDHAFAVRAIDQAQNTDQSPASSAFSVDTAAPEAPTINTSTPTSPANENDPELAGDAEAGSTVRIYKAPTTDDCTPANLAATGSAAEFAAGLTVNVANDTTTTFRATASDAGNTSACGAAFTYLEDSAAPETTIDSGPSGPTANNDPSFTFSGSDPGGSGVASFECSLDGAAFAACSSPEDYTDLDEGDHAFAVRAIDQAQNTDQSPASSAFSVDTAAPEAPTINTSTPTSPANENDPELAGDAEAGSTVRIYKAPTTDDCTPANLAATGSAAEFAAGLTVNVANDTTTTFRATASDAGNTSACGAAFTYLEDSAAPETTIDSGPSGPTANNDPSFTFSGSDPGGSGVASFECSLDGAAFAACSSPEDYTDLDEGDHAFAVRAIDQAQNTDQSPASSAFSVDTAAPEAPTINTSTPTSPANENDPELAGDAEAGSTVRIYKAPTTDDCTPANLAATGSAAEFAAGLTVNVANDTTTTFRATASDAGNTSACGAAFTYLEDSAAPETTIDSGPSGPTANNDPSFTFSGSDPGGSGVASFECSLDGAAFAACSSPEDYTDLDEGDHAFAVRAIDQAQNTDQSPASSAFSVDTAAPEAPTINTSTPTSPANENDPELAGDAEAGSTVRIYQSGDCSGPVEAQGSAGAFASPGLTVTVADDSDSSFTATASDAGNTSGCSAPFSYREDSTAPAAPTINDSDPNSPANDNNPELKGSAAAGSTVRLYQSGNCAGAIEAQGSAGQFASPGLTATVANNTNNAFTATATDAAGNTSTCSAAFNYVEDSTAPAAPTINDSDPNSPANDNNPELKGSAAAGSTVRLYQSGNCAGAIEAQGSAGQFASPGLTATVANNTNNAFTATATNAAGNTSTCSAAFNYVEDSTAPAAPTINDSDPNSPANDNNPELKGSAAAGSTVRLYQSGNCAGAIEAQGSAGQFASPGLTATVANNTNNAFTATATDAAGNTSTCSAAFNYVEDSTAPAAPTINDSDPNSPANDNNPELKGSAAAGSTVRLYQSGNCTGAIEAQGSAGQFASPGLTATVANNTNNAFTATATDAAGNTSTCSAAFNYVEDSTPPQTTITSGPSDNTRDRTPTFRFTSSEPSGARFQCRVDGASFSACSSPKTLSTLSFGNHTFRVRAIDQAGNVDSKPARRTFTVVR